MSSIFGKCIAIAMMAAIALVWQSPPVQAGPAEVREVNSSIRDIQSSIRDIDGSIKDAEAAVKDIEKIIEDEIDVDVKAAMTAATAAADAAADADDEDVNDAADAAGDAEAAQSDANDALGEVPDPLPAADATTFTMTAQGYLAQAKAQKEADPVTPDLTSSSTFTAIVNANSALGYAQAQLGDDTADINTAAARARSTATSTAANYDSDVDTTITRTFAAHAAFNAEKAAMSVTDDYVTTAATAVKNAERELSAVKALARAARAAAQKATSSAVRATSAAADAALEAYMDAKADADADPSDAALARAASRAKDTSDDAADAAADAQKAADTYVDEEEMPCDDGMMRDDAGMCVPDPMAMGDAMVTANGVGNLLKFGFWTTMYRDTLIAVTNLGAEEMVNVKVVDDMGMAESFTICLGASETWTAAIVASEDGMSSTLAVGNPGSCGAAMAEPMSLSATAGLIEVYPMDMEGYLMGTATLVNTGAGHASSYNATSLEADLAAEPMVKGAAIMDALSMEGGISKDMLLGRWVADPMIGGTTHIAMTFPVPDSAPGQVTIELTDEAGTSAGTYYVTLDKVVNLCNIMSDGMGATMLSCNGGQAWEVPIDQGWFKIMADGMNLPVIGMVSQAFAGTLGMFDQTYGVQWMEMHDPAMMME